MINIEKDGPDKFVKQTFPLRFGKYSELKTSDFEFCFKLNGEIKSVRGFRDEEKTNTPILLVFESVFRVASMGAYNNDWPHPAEQFKRTA